MKINKLYEYYQFGYNYNILMESKDGVTNKTLANRLAEYLDFIKELDLVVTSSGIDLYGLDVLYEQIKSASEDVDKKETKVDTKVLTEIKEKLKKIDSILDAELNTKTGYILDQKRHPNNTLIKDINLIFAEGVFSLLPDMAKEDFKEAGLCLAFDRYTAAAFHALRGTEDVIKFYSSKLLTKKLSSNATWGSFLTAIEKEIKSKKINPAPSTELMINLDNLRKYHRNKTQHPIRIYSCDESQDLISTCVSAINETIKDLKNRKIL